MQIIIVLVGTNNATTSVGGRELSSGWSFREFGLVMGFFGDGELPY